MRSPESKSRAFGPLEQIGKTLRSARVIRRLTQEELARAVGVTRPTVVAAEAGRSVSSQNLFALLEFLGVRLTSGAMASPNPARRRPNIAELVGGERLRRQRLFASAGRGADRETLVGAAVPAATSLEASVRVEAQRARPRIGDLMVAERGRRVMNPSTTA